MRKRDYDRPECWLVNWLERVEYWDVEYIEIEYVDNQDVKLETQRGKPNWAQLTGVSVQSNFRYRIE